MLRAPPSALASVHGHAVQLGCAVVSPAVQVGGCGFGTGSAGGTALGG